MCNRVSARLSVLPPCVRQPVVCCGRNGFCVYRGEPSCVPPPHRENAFIPLAFVATFFLIPSLFHPLRLTNSLCSTMFIFFFLIYIFSIFFIASSPSALSSSLFTFSHSLLKPVAKLGKNFVTFSLFGQ